MSFLFMALLFCRSCPLGDNPLLLLLCLLRLLLVNIGGGDGGGHEHARLGHVDGALTLLSGAAAAVAVRVGAGTGGGREGLTQGVLSILLAQVMSPPDTCADPDACDSNDDDNQKDNPFPMVRKPITTTT